MNELLYISIGLIFILGALVAKYAYLACREAEKLYKLED